jgi:spore coat protein CotH
MKRMTIILLFGLLLAAIAAGSAVSEGTESEKEHPCIRIMTEDGQPILSREEYVPATIQVFNCDEAYEMAAEGGVRVRGHSTAEQGEEKPYRIRFEKKQNMLGLHDGRKYRNWVLLRTYWHLCPDYMGFRLAKTIFGGRYYSSDCMFVNLYLNDKDLGVYLLCEQNQAARDRMDVIEPDEGDGRTDIGYLLEMENYPDDEHPGFAIAEKPYTEDIAGRKRVVPGRYYAIKSDIWSEEQAQYIENWLTEAYNVLYEAAVNGKAMELNEDLKTVAAENMTPFEAVDKLLDLESLADMLILEELVQNYDVGAGSFYMAVDFSEDSRYEKLTFLGPWDFSWGYLEPADGGYYACTFQNMIQGMDNSNPWFVLAMKMEAFRTIVKDRWKKLSDSGKLTDTTIQVLADIEALAGDLGEENAEKLEKGREIVEYVNARIRWLDEQWNEDE